MSVLITIMVGLVIWIVAWALGLKSIVGFLVPLALALIAYTAYLIRPYLPGNRE